MVLHTYAPPAHFPEHLPYLPDDICESDTLHKPPHILVPDNLPMLLSDDTPSDK